MKVIFTDYNKKDAIYNSLIYGKPVKTDAYFVVQHQTTNQWIDYFQKNGVDATIIPPSSGFGRLSVAGNQLHSSRISTPGLYVQRVKNARGILLLVKQNELSLSTESAQFKFNTTPLHGLYLNDDALVVKKIPPQRILGSIVYHFGYEGEKPGWEFIPNQKCLKSKFGSIARKIKFVNDKLIYR